MTDALGSPRASASASRFEPPLGHVDGSPPLPPQPFAEASNIRCLARFSRPNIGALRRSDAATRSATSAPCWSMSLAASHVGTERRAASAVAGSAGHCIESASATTARIARSFASSKHVSRSTAVSPAVSFIFAGCVVVQPGPVRGDHGVRGVEVRELVPGKVVIARVRDLLVAEHRPQRRSAKFWDGDVVGRHGGSMGEIRETEAVHLGREDGVGDGAALGVRGRVAPRPSRRVVLVVDERSPRAVLRAERLPHHLLRVCSGVGEDARERLDGSRVNQGPSHGFRGGSDLCGERGGIVRVREGPPRRDFARPSASFGSSCGLSISRRVASTSAWFGSVARGRDADLDDARRDDEDADVVPAPPSPRSRGPARRPP